MRISTTPLEYFNRLWAKYEVNKPVDSKVNNALTYAQNQVQVILSYMRANNLEIREGADRAGGGE